MREVARARPGRRALREKQVLAHRRQSMPSLRRRVNHKVRAFLALRAGWTIFQATKRA